MLLLLTEVGATPELLVPGRLGWVCPLCEQNSVNDEHADVNNCQNYKEY